METIKRGSRGEAVKTLQRALNLLADGIYGPLTEEGVKNFQRANSLTADGVVGPKTWAKILPGGSARVITGIILHCTATQEGHSATVAAIRNFRVNVRGFSDIGYHFVIYPDGSVHVGRDISISGAHCTGHNAHTIGISYVGGLDANGKPKDTRTPAQKKAIADLVAKLCATYNIPKSNIYGHNEFANKACPCFNVKNEFRK